jgi:predicted SnoaL-like aldol condensation-catalyzing enzyme
MKSTKSLIVAAAFVLMASPFTAFAQSAPRDLAAEEANRKLVVEFYVQVFNRHEVAAGGQLLGDDYKQHNPLAPDGKEPLVKVLTERFAKTPDSRARIVRSVAQGDLVWLHIHSTLNAQDRGRAIVDIFRVRNGKIVEHWDVIQAVPENPANSNTMF